MPYRCDFYSDEEYQQACALEEQQYKEQLALEEYEKEFEREGIRIVYFPYTRGVSSTKITEALDNVRKDNLQDLK